jgi:hypothetical protein
MGLLGVNFLHDTFRNFDILTKFRLFAVFKQFSGQHDSLKVPQRLE